MVSVRQRGALRGIRLVVYDSVVDDVVPADRLAVVANDVHRDGLGHARVLKEAGRCMAQRVKRDIVNVTMNHPGLTGWFRRVRRLFSSFAQEE